MPSKTHQGDGKGCGQAGVKGRWSTWYFLAARLLRDSRGAVCCTGGELGRVMGVHNVFALDHPKLQPTPPERAFLASIIA